MNPSSSSSKTFQIPSLDGLRAGSILIVFLSHAGFHRWVPGLFGVTVFFFLSGYLITTLLRLESEQTGTIHLRDFYARRAIRILPPYFLVLGSVFLLTALGILNGQFTWSTFAAQSLFLSNYWELVPNVVQPPGTEVFWSLAVEEHFYLLFPVFYLGLRRIFPNRRHQFLALATLAGGVLVWRLALVHLFQTVPLDPNTSHYPRFSHATDTRVDSLLFGCMLAVYGNPALDSTAIGRRVWTGIGLPIGLAILVFTFVQRDPAFRETFRYTLQGIAMFPIFIAAIRFPEWGILRALNWRWIRFLGVLSYPLYLTHSAIVSGLERWLPSAGIPALAGGGLLSVGMRSMVAFALSFGVSLLIHYSIEKPLAKLRRKMSRVRAPVASRGTEIVSGESNPIACEPRVESFALQAPCFPKV